MLLCLRTYRAIVDNRAACDRVHPVIDKNGWVHEIAIFIVVSNTEFRNLTCTSAVWILMAADTCCCVVHRAQTRLHGMVLFINLLVESKSISCGFRNSIADALCTVETGSAEPCRCFFSWLLTDSGDSYGQSYGRCQ